MNNEGKNVKRETSFKITVCLGGGGCTNIVNIKLY